MKKILLSTLVLLIPFITFSQEKWEAGLLLGYSNYLGDLVEPSFTLDQSSFSGGIFLRNRISNNFGARMNLLYGRLEGSDNNYMRNLARSASFEASVVEVSALGEFDLLGHKRKDENGGFKRFLSPYVFAGLGICVIDPDINFDGTDISDDVQEDINADNSNIHAVLPIGLGIRFDLNKRINIGIEYGMRFTFTDYIDGVSESGDPDNNDVYNIGGLVVGIMLGISDADKDGIADDEDKCPDQPGPRTMGGCPDSDNDGLADQDDSCPNQPGEVRMNGCPDRDSDGVADNVDDCPDDPGLRRFSGCPDTDNDNIVDKEDLCPTLPGIPALNGCPDRDRDGITDAKDGCPDHPGSFENNGCPDSDNDGITDDNDDCPNQPGTQRFNGCPDSDNDGLTDAMDKCPTIAGPASNGGCPEISEADQKTLDFAMKNVQFQTGSAELLSSSLSVLNQVADLMKRYEGYALSIDGYTDSVGDDLANQQLSEQRAEACYDYLISKGINPALMSFKGHGENKPVASNDTETGRRQNRRVEFTLAPK